MLERVNIRSAVPVYTQIENEVSFAIASGKLKPGDRLPTVRELAERLKTNPNTVAKSFRDLELRGYLNTYRGRGIFVDKNATERCKRDCRRQIIGRLYCVLTEAKAAGYVKKDLDEMMKVCLGAEGGPYDELPADVSKLADGR